MANLIDAMKKENSWKLTENGQPALATTLDATLDLFSVIGALRMRNEEDIIQMFVKAWAENPTLALKMLFYNRDCRGGQGEKRTFRTIAKYMADNHSEAMKRNMHLIPEYGRWDDLYAFDGTNLEFDAYALMAKQFNEDVKSDNPSVLAKWLKSENTSSKESRKLGTKTREFFNITPREYRKALSELRAKIDVVEKKMSSNNWTDIDYSTVPSIAHKNYHGAFYRHDENGYCKYLQKVESGEEEIKAAQLFPYDLVKAYCTYGCRIPRLDPTIEAQWKAMPKYLTDKNYLVMADVSGSMTSNDMLPMATAVGLAIKFAEENTGAFKGHYMTFTDEPSLNYVSPDMTLREKIQEVMSSKWGMTTNLEAAFNLILNTAIKDKLTQDDMPEALLIISDMEINAATDTYNWNNPNDCSECTTFTDTMKRRFEAAGYKMPTLIYWNVNARANTFHATTSDDVRFVSGSSPSIFKDLCENMGSSPKEFMLNVLNSERYELVK